ncbi:putative E3 ubiquitin-protein ligase UBR7 isoform X1 [Tripterygium wilfordii]|uniref:putative E3 ubiquitin-protein ligase UBR7 isoform X1 n=1 Tax=Tripterygium wilfordii TaxID=458696 RepID=UPI0018F850CA|nr:putative E3 ubiquitin-protein ligase UBR7 isoform X1 [Tripterygium wilfordii]XP_038715256.1 putative E3 ubiquitin-protein ligase UBR7 isoform X1 [Tripterygium wilfordii]XP_038715257.1 putative E3 ubiquitin-protein ligase UBR7 isoform X1 [Tripterygium wilfordii]
MAGIFDDELYQTLTIYEYIDKVDAEELEADLVLGGDEGKECTYAMGYMKRQAIFSCMTCTPDGNAGMCTACSLSCHDGHEIVELWTKRRFRCDCGNSKFGEFSCKLFANKDVENAHNSYNHNFKGLYCTCDRPYPDPDVNEQVEMIQCCICEDWFHEVHLGLHSLHEIPRDEEGEPIYEDFICKSCSAACSFLTLYPQTIWVKGEQHDAAADEVTSSTSEGKNVLEDISSAEESRKLEKARGSRNSPNSNNLISMSEPVSAGKEVVIGESSKIIDTSQCTKNVTPSGPCLLGVDVAVVCPVSEGKPLFLSKNWRESLCRCEMCVDMYNQRGISYLLDKEDSIAEYEKTATQKREEKLQQREGAEVNFFNKLGHVEKMQILSGIADFKDEFRSFLENFDSSKPITSDDVLQIFENLRKKRQRVQ